MKKWVIVVLVLFLCGVNGCPQKVEEKIISSRGLNVNFIEPRFRIIDGENTLKVGKDFDVVVRVSHKLKHRGVSGDIFLTSSSSKDEKLFGSGGFKMSEAEVEQEIVKAREEIVELGTFRYGEKMRDEVDSLNLNINSKYNGLVISELCFDDSDEMFGCKNDETLKGGKLGGDNNGLPVAIDRIEKWVSDFESDSVDFDLIIYFKNYGSGKIEGEIGSFIVEMRDGTISCNDISLEDDKWKIECEGSKIYGESQISFSFDYTYVTKQAVAFRVV